MIEKFTIKPAQDAAHYQYDGRDDKVHYVSAVLKHADISVIS